MESGFIDVGAHRRDLSDLVSQGIVVVPLQRSATAPALLRLDLESLSKLFEWYQRPGVSLVTGLSTALAPRRRGRRSPLELDSRRIGGGGLDELVELRLSLACSSEIVFSSSAICRSNEPKTSRSAA